MARTRRTVSLTLALDGSSPTPLHEQIYQKIRVAIQTGGLSAGERLPSVRQLTADLGVSHTTVEQAYLELSTEGYVTAVPRSGYVVEQIDTEFFFEERPDVRGAVSAAVARSQEKGLVAEDITGHGVPYDFSYVNLRAGSFPLRAWQRAASDICLGDDLWATRYNYHGGISVLQRELASYLAQTRGVTCRPEQIVLEPGTAAAISEFFQLFDATKDVVGVEEPGWQVPRIVAENLGFAVTPLKSGSKPGTLVKCLRTQAPTLAFLTPSHQFPTGSVLPLASRVEAIEWASETDAYLVEDDSCNEYRYDMRPIPSLQSLDHRQRTVYLGNFSKTLSPSLRIAYMVLPPMLLDRYFAAFPSGHPGISAFDTQVLARLMENGTWARHVRRMAQENKRVHDKLLACLQTTFGDLLDIRGKHSGMHLFVTVRNGMSADELISSALGQGAKVYSAERFWFTRQPQDATVMLGFSAMEYEDVKPAVEALARAWLG